MVTVCNSLTSEEIEKFNQQGFLGPFTALSPSEISVFRDKLYRLVLPPFDPQNFDRHSRRHLDSVTVFTLCSTPVILDHVRSILGNDVVLWGSNLFEKPGHALEEYPWHQDSHFWKLEPMITLSVWLAITASTEENGCVEVIPGSHKLDIPVVESQDIQPGHTRRFWGQSADPSYFHPEEAIALTLKPGEFFLFHERTLHRSRPNYTTSSRLGLGMRFTLPSVQVNENVPCILLNGCDRFELNEYVAPPTTDPLDSLSIVSGPQQHLIIQ